MTSCCAWSASADVLLESFRPGRARPARRRLRAPARGEPALGLLRDHRLWVRTGPNVQRSGHDMNYLGLNGVPGVERRRRWAADPGRRPDRRPRRRRADGRLRDPRRATRARPQRRGSARRRLDVRRRALVAGDGRRARTSRQVSSRVAGPRCSAARCSATALPVRRRLGHARRAGAEVLRGVVPRSRPRGLDRAPVRGARQPRSRRGRDDLRRTHPRRMGGLRPTSTTAAWSRCWRSRRRWSRSSSARARW